MSQEPSGWLELWQGRKVLGGRRVHLGGTLTALGLLAQRAVFPIALFYYGLLAGRHQTA